MSLKDEGDESSPLALEGRSPMSIDSDEHDGKPHDDQMSFRSPNNGSPVKEPWTKRIRSCLSEPGMLLCISHLFSYWGDRMWGFAIGLYLVEMTPDSLRLTAIFGLVRTLSMVIFGPAVGDWVDVTPRLRAVKLSLVTQNILVSICAVMVLLHLLVHPPREEKAVYIALEAAIIVLGAMAFLVGRGTTIAVERDWVVVITDGDQERLAGLNTTLRRIDLTCAILGPAAVGFIMSLVSKYAGIILICSWNVASFFLEYYLLLYVYKRVPALAIKGEPAKASSKDNGVTDAEVEDRKSESGDEDVVRVKQSARFKVFNVLRRIRSFWKGWSVYARQSVALAGLSLAMLYLTFLGFSSITTGYVYTQRLSEGVISACYAAASLVGILGTVLFPPLRRKVGLPRTGLISFLLQLSMLALCVVSIWLPGSPLLSTKSNLNKVSPIRSAYSCVPSQSQTRTRLVASASTISMTPQALVQPTPSDATVRPLSTAAKLLSNTIKSTPTVKGNNTLRTSTLFYNFSSSQLHNTYSPTGSIPILICNNTNTNKTADKSEPFSYWSVAVLVTGLILSRAGLWMTDLTVTQLLQENVIETERGIVSGTQQAFNSILDLTHYVLTIFLPSPGQFWMLILVSYGAIVLGYIIYIVFYIRFTRKRPQDHSETAAYGSLEQLIDNDR